MSANRHRALAQSAVTHARRAAGPVLAPVGITVDDAKGPVRRLGAFPGTFDPLTIAHTGVAEAAMAAGCDRVLLCVPVTSVDKEQRGSVVDRLACVVRATESVPGFGAAATNGGLYVEIAEAARRLAPDADVDLVCGADKVVQIFDARYYAEPLEAILARLFAVSRLLVAPRRGYEIPCHSHVEALTLDESYLDVSASEVRRLLGLGRDVGHLLAD